MTNAIDLTGKTVLIAGASSGIGAATAAMVARGGGRVIGIARRSDVLESVISGLPGTGHLALTADATDAEAVAAILANLPQDVRPIDGVVFCLGTHMLRPARITSAQHYSEMFRQHVLTATNFLPGLLRMLGSGASIVLVSSAARIRGGAAAGAYIAAKEAMVGLARAWAAELAPRVRVNSVSPGVVQTAMTERFLGGVGPKAAGEIQKRHLLGFGSPEQAAGPIAFLLSDHASWITGTDLVVDGGFSVQA